jgi:autotransporter-associated beta strand protein
MLVVTFLCALPAVSDATQYYWDADGGSVQGTLNYGSGVISTSNTNWWSASGTEVGWTNSTADTMNIGSGTAVDGASYTGGASAPAFTLMLSGSVSADQILVSGNLNSGNAVTISDGGNSSNTLSLPDGGVIGDNSATSALVINAQILGGGNTSGITKINAGTVVFAENNSYTGITTIEGQTGSSGGGVLQIGNGGTTGSLGSGSVIFTLNGGTQTLASTLAFDRSDADSFSNQIVSLLSNTVGAIIEQIGGNTLTLSGQQTIANPSATLTYQIAPTGQSIDTLVTAAVTGSGAILKSGAGTLSFSGTDTYTGNTTINAGTFMIGGSGQLGSGNYAGNIAISSGATFAYDSAASQTLSGIVSGTGGLTLNGSGTLTLSSSDTYSGNTTINAGTLVLTGFNSSGAAQGVLGASNVTVNSGGAFRFGLASNYGDTVIGTSPAPTPISTAQNITLNNGTLTVVTGTNGSNAATAAGISGTLTVASGLNFVSLNPNGAASHYTGFTSGFLRDAGAAVLVNAPHTVGSNPAGEAGSENLIFTSGTTLTDNVLAGVFIAQSSSPLDATTIATYSASAGVDSGGVNAYGGISGSLSNTTDPIAGVSNGNYTGTASGGVDSLRLDNSLNLGGFTLTVSSGMILARGNFNITTGTLALGAEGEIYVSNNDSTHATNAAHSMSISSVITGSNGLTYIGGWTGQGTLNLSGNDTYTGATTINTGTLFTSGSLAGTASGLINNTGVLGGTGVFGAVGATGTTSVSAGGTIAPGVTTGTAGTKLTMNTSVTFNNGSTFAVNLDATNDKVDLLAINGNLALSGSDTLTVNLINGALPASGSYEIASYTGSLFGTFMTPSNLPAGYQLDYSDPHEILIDIAAIPEPGACAMTFAGVATLWGIKRVRRHRRKREKAIPAHADTK